MVISAIVAVSLDGFIGKDNAIPWHLPADLAYFKRVTMGFPVIMGRNSFDSIGKPLPGRLNIIVTRNKQFFHSGCTVCHTIHEAIRIAHDSGAEECFIIGGGNIYLQTIDLWDKLYFTTIHANIEGDVRFPEIDFSLWAKVSSIDYQKDEKNIFDMTFATYEKYKQSKF
ncbi:MAG: dihydrofolate reductase [Saprospiraceae bacterium]